MQTAIHVDDHDPSHVCDDHPKILGVVNTLHFTEFWCQKPGFHSGAFQVVTLSPEAVSGWVSCLATVWGRPRQSAGLEAALGGPWRFRKRLKFQKDPHRCPNFPLVG